MVDLIQGGVFQFPPGPDRGSAIMVETPTAFQLTITLTGGLVFGPQPITYGVYYSEEEYEAATSCNPFQPQPTSVIGLGGQSTLVITILKADLPDVDCEGQLTVYVAVSAFTVRRA